MNSKLIAIISIFLIHHALIAQIQTPEASPAATIGQTIGFTKVDIEYNRPQLKSRDMFKDLTREGEVWRTGANMCTRLTLSDDITIEKQLVPKGKYSIYSIPGKKSWTIILNKKISWGTQYDPSEDVIRISVPTKTSSSYHENFTFYFSDVTENSGVLGFAWEKTKVELGLSVDLHEKIMSQINATMSNEDTAKNPDFFNAADYYIKNKLDPKKALHWASIFAEKMNDQYWAHGLKARAEAYAGQFTDAVATGKKVIAMAEKANNRDYVHNFTKLVKEWEQQ